MKKKIILVVMAMTALLFCACLEKSDEVVTEEKVTNPISITTEPPCETGNIKIYGSINGVLFDGYGEITIKNNGWNGNPIEIEMYVNEGE